jgi:hypothetical protein
MLEYLPDPTWVFPAPLMLQPAGIPQGSAGGKGGG